MNLIRVGKEADTNALQISEGVGIDDKTLLEIMRDRGDPESGEVISVSDAVASMVAGALLELEIIEGGARLVMPTSGIIRRGFVGKASSDDDDGTLFALRRRLHEVRSPADIIGIGLQLGDRGVHVAAGWGGKIRNMGRKEQARYAAGMALMGYATALEAVNAHPRAREVSLIKGTVPILRERIGDVISVMMHLHPQAERLKNEIQNGGDAVLGNKSNGRLAMASERFTLREHEQGEVN